MTVSLCLCWYKNSRKLVKNGSKTIFSFCCLMEYSLATSSRHMVNGTTSCNHHNKPTKFHLHHRDLCCHYRNQHLHLQKNRKSIVESCISILCNTKKLVKNKILKVSFPGHSLKFWKIRRNKPVPGSLF